MIVDISYFQKINNTYKSSSKQETELYELNNFVNYHFDESLDYNNVKKNNVDFELLIIKHPSITYKKKIKSRPNQLINLGDNIYWNNQNWMITAIDTDDKTYNSGEMSLCTVLLKWQNSNGKIIERWCFDEDISKNSSSLDKNKTMILKDDKCYLKLVLDDETKFLKEDKRFIIDEDGIAEPKVFKIINREVKSMNYGYFNRGKIVNLTLESDELNKTSDNIELGICDYIPPSPTPPTPSQPYSEIIARHYVLKSGSLGSKFTAVFKDEQGAEISGITPKWNVVSDYPILQTIGENSITLKIDNDDVIGSTFKLQIINEGYFLEKEIKITGLF